MRRSNAENENVEFMKMRKEFLKVKVIRFLIYITICGSLG